MSTQLTNVALTVLSYTAASYTFPSEIVLDVKGGPFYNPMKISNTSQASYWMIIFDRSTLKIVENFTFTDNASIPPQAKNYLGNSDYFYVLTTFAMSSQNVPTGALYKWLISEGAGKGLRTVEQNFAALNCSAFQDFSYTLVDIFGDNSGTGTIDDYNLQLSSLFTAIELQPITVGGKTLYTPVELK